MDIRNKKIKNTGLALLAVLILIQFFHPAHNVSGETAYDISRKYHIPDTVQAILRTSCYDCHSNHTDYPWYDHIQPVASWMGHHVNEGKEELNFNEFSAYSIGRQYHKLEEISRQINEEEMPMGSYTLIHRHAKLSEAQRYLITAWADALHDSIRAVTPADSLKRPMRRRPE